VGGPGSLALAGFAAALLASAPAAAESPGGRERLADFTGTRKREAGAELRSLDRAAERRLEEARLAREGSPEQIERHRTRVRAEDSLDRLDEAWAVRRAGVGADPARFGPQTRFLLERSEIELRWVERRAESDLRLHALEREVRAREERASPAPFQSPASVFEPDPPAP
jgi:hypothetical protein